MNTIEIPDRNLTIEIPSHWDEMTAREVFYCLSQILRVGSPPDRGRTASRGGSRQESGDGGGFDMLAAQIKCFYKIAGIRRSWKSIFLEKIMPDSWVQEKNANAATHAQQLTAFLFTGSEKTELNYNTILNHFPVVKDLYGPADLLSDITFGEFRSAIEEMNDYFSEKDEKQLSRFIATLYRPERKNYHELSKSENFDGQRREPFNRNRIEANARLCNRMHPVHRTAILLWFTYCINYIQTEDLIISGRTINLKTLFPKREGKSPLNKGGDSASAESGGSGSGWTSILYHIAKEGIFGNAEATDKTGLFDVLLYMYDQYMENKRIKAKYSKKK